jgi:UDP-N-acetylmuramoyl-tripeptide--D-alanyl-D-alanine ligase
MRALTAQWVANAVGGVLAADVDAQVLNVTQDSRAVTPGSLYVAFVGERVDGHDYVPQALAGGATLCLVSQEVSGPHVLVQDVEVALGKLARAYLALLRVEGAITVIGITGSNGKTTTKDLLAQVLPQVVAPVGSFNNEIGMPLTVLSADNDTRHLVLEMGASKPGDIAYLTSIAPVDVAVVLTVGSAHLEFYPHQEALAREKSTLLAGLVDGGLAVLNADDPHVAAMASGAQRLVTFGHGVGQVRARHVSLVRGRARIEVEHVDTGERASGQLSLIGEHHVTNALAAICVARECGMTFSDAVAAVSAAGPVSKHRMALVERADGVTFVDDSYNASPESMRAALRALKEVADGGRTFAVLGEMREMGERSVSAHAELGLEAVRLRIDHLLVVGPGARPAFDSAVREGSWGDEAAYVGNIDEARDYLDACLTAGDTVLVKASHGSELWKLADDLTGDHR